MSNGEMRIYDIKNLITDNNIKIHTHANERSNYNPYRHTSISYKKEDMMKKKISVLDIVDNKCIPS